MSRPTLPDVLQRFIADALDDVHVALPGIVTGYDATTQRASVQPAVRRGVLMPDGTRIAEQLPELKSVPVVHASGGGARITFPVAVGDSVLLVVSSQSLDRWLASNATGTSAVPATVDPVDDRRHDLTDAVALLGFHGPRPLANAPTDRASFGYDTGASVEVHPDEVRVGGDDASGAGNAIAIKNTIDNVLGLLQDPGFVSAMSIGVGVPAAVTAYLIGSPMPYATKAKAR